MARSSWAGRRGPVVAARSSLRWVIDAERGTTVTEPAVPPIDTEALVAAVAEIDRRSERVRDAGDDFSAMDALWRAVYALDRWFFIARGEDDAPTPFAAQLEKGPMIFAGTTPTRVRDAGIASGLSEEDASKILAVPLPSAVDWAGSFAAAGVFGIVFDRTETGYFAPLENLVPMREWMTANPAT